MTTIYSTGPLGWRAIRNEAARARLARLGEHAVLLFCAVAGAWALLTPAGSP